MSAASASRIAAVLAVVAALAGCDDPAAERGVPPPLAFDRSRVAVPLYSYGSARRLRSGINTLANGDMGSLRAMILTTDGSEARAARDRLIDDGIAPSAIMVRHVPDDLVVVTRTTVRGAPCRAAINPGWLGDAGNSLDSLGRCVQADNLAAMADDPADLVRPTRLGAGDGAVAAQAVLDWERGGTKSQAGAPGNAPGTGDADAGGSAGGATSLPATGSQSGAAAAPAGANPLFAPRL